MKQALSWSDKADELLRLGLMNKGQREFLGTLQPDAAEFIVDNLIKENQGALDLAPSKVEETRTLDAANLSTRYIMRLDDVPRFDGSRPRDGDYYLRSFDPDANDGQGAIEMTGAIDRAQQFESPVDVYNLWRSTTLLQYQAEVVTSDGRAVICRRCVAYVATGGAKEVYEYDPPEGYKESGARIYIDVERCREIIKLANRKPNWEDKRENLLPHVLAHEIYEPHLPHVSSSISNPGLMLRFEFTRLDDGTVDQLHVFADGNHRLAADLAAGAPFFFYALTVEESLRVSTTNLFDVCRETLVNDLITLCERREEKPVEFYDRSLENWQKAKAAYESGIEGDPERPTLTEVNRLEALRDAAFVMLRTVAIDAPWRHCPKTDEHSTKPCPLCGVDNGKGKDDE